MNDPALRANGADTGGDVTLHVELPGGRQFSRTLDEGASLSVGSADDCDVRLPDESVQAIHCMLGRSGGEVWVRDCYSRVGTLVDGRRISETRLRSRAVVQVGMCRLVIELPASSAEQRIGKGEGGVPNGALGQSALRTTAPDDPAARVVPDAPPASPAPSVSASAPPPEARLLAEAGLLPRPDEFPRATVDLRRENGHEAPAAEADDRRDQPGPNATNDAERRDAETSHHGIAASSVAAPSNDEELVQALRSRIARLETELADRDDRIAELRELAEQQLADEWTAGELGGGEARLLPEAGLLEAAESEEQAAEPETAGLVARLEQLLDELERKDERERLLEELLRSAEDANRAEQEERRQLEAWVEEIEQRLGEREAQSQAEVQALQERIDELTNDRDRLERALSRTTAPAASSDAQEAAGDEEAADGTLYAMLSRTREALEETKEALARAQAERQELQRRLAAGAQTVDAGDDSSGASSTVRDEVERLLREERLQLAREHAELARQRAELARRAGGGEGSQDAESGPHQPAFGLPPDGASEQRSGATDTKRNCLHADERLRVLREHLQAVNEEEAQVRQNRGLSARIARLWRRIEGRG